MPFQMPPVRHPGNIDRRRDRMPHNIPGEPLSRALPSCSIHKYHIIDMEIQLTRHYGAFDLEEAKKVRPITVNGFIIPLPLRDDDVR